MQKQAKIKIENAYAELKSPKRNLSNQKKWLRLENSLQALPMKFKTL